MQHHGRAELTFLRDPGWTVGRTYTRPDSVVPVTRFEHAALGLSVELTDVVSPDADVLSRQLRVRRAPSSPVGAAWLAVYENLSPTPSKVPELPVADWALDHRDHYATLFDDTRRAIVHFSPTAGAGPPKTPSATSPMARCPAHASRWGRPTARCSHPWFSRAARLFYLAAMALTQPALLAPD